MKALFLVLPCVGAFLVAMPCAQLPAATKKPLDPAVEALLAKMAGRRGVPRAGVDTAIAMAGRYEVGFEGVGSVAKGRQIELFVGTELARCTSELGEHGAMEKGMRGDLVWEADPQMGPKVLHRTHAAAARRYFAALRGDDPRTIYQQIEKAGTQTVDGREHTVLRMTPADGRPDAWFVAADGTLTRIDTALPTPESAEAAFGVDDLMAASITFGEWQESAGGRFAKVRVLAMGKATVTTTFDSIVIGEAIDASKFTPPPAVTKLAKEPPPAEGPGYKVVEPKAQPVASIRTKVKVIEISTQLAVLLPEVGMQVMASGVKGMGVPFARYHSIEDGIVDLEAGMSVQQAIQEKGRVKNSELPGGRCVTCWHIGPYDRLAGARQALLAHLEAEKLKLRGGTWAVFWTDPGMVPDPAKWKTQLFAPVE